MSGGIKPGPVFDRKGIVWEILNASTLPTASSAVGGQSELADSLGVWGVNEKGGDAVRGESPANKAFGILGGTDRVFKQHAGVYGESDQQGVFGNSTSNAGTGVYGICNKGTGFGVRGDCQEGGIAIQGQSFGTGLAGKFIGDVEVTGDIRLTNQDCAEDFDILSDQSADPGTVMVLGEGGALRTSSKPYDKTVAGIISGAGDFKPASVLGKQAFSQQQRAPIALMGKVFCKVDASYGPIEAGDLLTTSATQGHAMKAEDPWKAFGSVIGKALLPFQSGCGLIPVLIALQ
jgi:hypothetical protein